jgi:hypothetical protein
MTSNGLPQWTWKAFWIFAGVMFVGGIWLNYRFSGEGSSKPVPTTSEQNEEKSSLHLNEQQRQGKLSDFLNVDFAGAVTNWAAAGFEEEPRISGIILQIPAEGEVWENTLILKPGEESEIFFAPIGTWMTHPWKTRDNLIRIQQYQLIDAKKATFKRFGEPVIVDYTKGEGSFGWQSIQTGFSFYHEQGGKVQLKVERRNPLDG